YLCAGPPLSGKDPVPAPPADAKPVQELQPGTQPAATPSDPGQTTPLQPGATRPTTLLSTSPMNDAARYLAGLPVATGSKLAALTQQSSSQAPARAMTQGFSELQQRQLNNIRVFRAENIAPVTQQSHTCVYLFSGPDFLY